MADFTLLHLSDVHFGMSDPTAEMPLVTDNLIKAVHKAKIIPDLCVFSGDLAQSGEPAQFQQGMEWLKKILQPFGDCPLAIVPGNHDLVRDPNKKKCYRAAAHDEKSFVDWRDELDNPARFQAFIDHCSSAQTSSRVRCLFDWSANLPAAFIRNVFGRLTVNLIGLNTALASADNEDEGRLVADLLALNTYLAKTDSKRDLTLVIGHHPLDWLAKWNREEIRNALARNNQGTHAWLCGHRHETESTSFASGHGQSLATLAAGAAYQPTKWAQHFAFYEFNLERSRIVPSVFGYNKDDNGWDPLPALSKEFPANLPERSAILVTEVTATSFDEEIKSKIRKALTEDELPILADMLRQEALRAEKNMADGDLADMLCAPGVALDQTIVWLTLASEKHLQSLRRQRSDDVRFFKDRIQEALGWLLLRAVNPAWLAENQATFSRAAGARVHVSLRRPSCIEVAVARAENRGARFRPLCKGSFITGERAIPLCGETGFDPPSTILEVKKTIWRDVIRRPVPKDFGKEELDELKETLSVKALARRHFHLTVNLDKTRHLTDADLDGLQEDFPELRLILIRVNGQETALLLGDLRLDSLIGNFFDLVFEEKTT